MAIARPYKHHSIYKAPGPAGIALSGRTALATLLVLFISLMLKDASSAAFPRQIVIDSEAVNTLSDFRMYTFPIGPASKTSLLKLAGTLSINFVGESFSEALISLFDIPNDQCSGKAEFKSYQEVREHYSGTRTLARFILKGPVGRTSESVDVHLDFAAPIPLQGCLILILDGAVLRSGGPITMRAKLIATTIPSDPMSRVYVQDLDDEFCFDRQGGCQLSTISYSNSTFRRITKMKRDSKILGVYGSISDSTFGWKTVSAKTPWKVWNDFYVARRCGLGEGVSGPIPGGSRLPESEHIGSVEFSGRGNQAFNELVKFGVDNLKLQIGDCIVHDASFASEASVGGLDAESQTMLLLERISSDGSDKP